ncbi:hypothetical protein HDV01_006751 [Terramyces sp. JEL0728]|nr:hypothetical protein HDV01_006751 [Terramyces sp. JEL0728]
MDEKKLENIIYLDHESEDFFDTETLDFELQDADFALEFTRGLISTEDDYDLPTFTARALLIGSVWAIFLGFTNTVASFRANPFAIPSTIANMVAYPIGLFLARTVPDITIAGIQFNPGPFNVKEHVLINIIVSAAASPPYGVDNVVAQKLFFNDQKVTVFSSLIWILVTQMLGYGLAGLLRRFLVKPTAMLWPSVLGSIGFFNSFHNQKGLDNPDSKYYHSMSRFSAFWLSFVFMFVYEWIPGYFAKSLASVSILCFITKNRTARFLGSAWFEQGPGILSFTFDWTFINGVYSPMYVLWNSIFGNILGMWIIAPLTYYFGAFGTPALQPTLNFGGQAITVKTWKNASVATDPLPRYATNALFDVHGYEVQISQGAGYPNLLDLNNNLNLEAFKQAGSRLYLSPAFAISYLSSFMTFGAMFSQVGLWYGKDIIRQFKEALRQTESDLDSNDPHYKIMKKYSDISELAYLMFFAFFLGLSVLFCQFSSFFMPWWATLITIFIGVICAIPVGVTTGITGISPGLNIITEMIGGLMFPGQTVVVMCFKSLGTNIMIQAVSLLGDLKLGHYMHIDPKAMVASQLLGTIIGVLINTVGAFWAMGSLVNITDPNSQYGAQSYLTFANAGGLWGALGPVRSFGPSSPYFSLNLGYLIGFALPFIPWTLNKLYPDDRWIKVNMFIIVTSMAPGVSTINSGYINVILWSIFVQYYLYNYQRDFWDKYVYSIQSAFDAAAPLVSFLIVLMTTYAFTPDQNQVGPFSPSGPYDYYCYGTTYDQKPIPATIGTPPQNIMLAVDSTESYGCIQTTNCGSNCNINDTLVYDSTKSSSYNRLNGNYPPRVILTDDSMPGPVATDNFHIGSMQFTNISFKQVKPTFERSQVSGVLGLGHSISNSFKDFQQGMSKPTYGFSVDPSSNFANLDLGFYNKSLYNGDISFVKEIQMPISSLFNQSNVNSLVTPYALPVNTIQVNGISIPNQNYTAFVHTDLSISQFPRDIVAPIQSTYNLTLGDDSVFEASCSLVKFLPTIVLSFNGFTASWAPQDYVYKYASSDQCFLGFTEYKNPLFKDNLILGMGMLSKYYLAFDHSNNQIGFANIAQAAAPVQTGQLPSATANTAFGYQINLFKFLLLLMLFK